jgi:hypothetical protein
MKTQTWLLLIIAGFIVTPGAGSVMVGLYVFNYTSALLLGWRQRRPKVLTRPGPSEQ